MPTAMDYYLTHDRLNALIKFLQKMGYLCIGPQVIDDAIQYQPISSASQLPWGIEDEQGQGSYRLTKNASKLVFSYANGPQCLKPLLFKPRELRWKVVRNAEGELIFEQNNANDMPMAIIGARSCDLEALAIQDKVFLDSGYIDKQYQHRRAQLFIVAANCTHPSSSCFCVSTQTGPKVRHSYDLALTETPSGIVVTPGGDKGQHVIDALGLRQAKNEEVQQAIALIEKGKRQQVKKMPYNNGVLLKEKLLANLEHPQWQDVAKRCLSCANCTLVCPTCFCSKQVEQAQIDSDQSACTQEWDSCYSPEHSHMHGLEPRGSIKHKYKFWLIHKLATWWDQFGSSGCVGCGRCVTWCPVGIDITQEANLLTRNRDE